MQVTCTLQNLIYTQQLNWTDKKVKTKNTWFLKQFQCFGLQYTFFYLSRMVGVMDGKFIKFSTAKQKLLRVSGKFELLRVRVTKGKIIVNV